MNILSPKESSAREQGEAQVQALTVLDLDIEELEERLELATLQMADCYNDAFECIQNSGGCTVRACDANQFECVDNAGICATNYCAYNWFGCAAHISPGCFANACYQNQYVCPGDLSGPCRSNYLY